MADTDRLDAGPSSSPSSTSSSPTQQRQGQEIGSDCEPMYGVHPDANHEPRYEVHQDARKYKIGEPFPDFEIGASVMYTHSRGRPSLCVGYARRKVWGTRLQGNSLQNQRKRSRWFWKLQTDPQDVSFICFSLMLFLIQSFIKLWV